MSEEPLVSRRYDWGDLSPVVAVIEVLSEANGTDPDAIPTLAETIDPESLNDLCANGATSNPVTVSFAHAGYDVTVRSDGFVTVDDA